MGYDYIILERNGSFINVVLQDDGSGTPIIFDDEATAFDYGTEHLAFPFQVVALTI